MIPLLVLVVVGAGFLFALYRFARGGPRLEGSGQSVLKARQALTVLQDGLLPSEMLERISAKADYDYVVATHAPGLRELFLTERRDIMLSWVNQMRRQVLNLRQFHLGSARFYAQLSLRTEAHLALEFFTLLWICRALQIALYFRGPYAAPRMVGRAVATAARVCEASEKALSFLKTAKIDTFPEDSASNLTAL